MPRISPVPEVTHKARNPSESTATQDYNRDSDSSETSHRFVYDLEENDGDSESQSERSGSESTSTTSSSGEETESELEAEVEASINTESAFAGTTASNNSNITLDSVELDDRFDIEEECNCCKNNCPCHFITFKNIRSVKELIFWSSVCLEVILLILGIINLDSCVRIISNDGSWNRVVQTSGPFHLGEVDYEICLGMEHESKGYRSWKYIFLRSIGVTNLVFCLVLILFCGQFIHVVTMILIKGTYKYYEEFENLPFNFFCFSIHGLQASIMGSVKLSRVEVDKVMLDCSQMYANDSIGWKSIASDNSLYAEFHACATKGISSENESCVDLHNLVIGICTCQSTLCFLQSLSVLLYYYGICKHNPYPHHHHFASFFGEDGLPIVFPTDDSDSDK